MLFGELLKLPSISLSLYLSLHVDRTPAVDVIAENGATPIGSGVRTGVPVSQRLMEGYDRGDFVYP